MNMQTCTSWMAMPLAVLLLVTTTVTQAGDKARSKLPTSIESAETTEGFGTRHAALQAAGPEESFDGKCHFIVCAPTGEASDELPGDLGLTADQLLANSEPLVAALKYHVVNKVLVPPQPAVYRQNLTDWSPLVPSPYLRGDQSFYTG